MSTTAYGFNMFINSASTDRGSTPRAEPAIILPESAVWLDALRWEWDIQDDSVPGAWWATGNRILNLPSSIPGSTPKSLSGQQLSLGIFDLNVSGTSNSSWTANSQIVQWVVALDVHLPGNRTNQSLFADPPAGVTASNDLSFANGVTSGRITFTLTAPFNPGIRPLPRFDGNGTTPVQGMAVWGMDLTFAQGANLPGPARCNISMWVQMQVGSQNLYFYKDPEMDFAEATTLAAAAAAGSSAY